MARLDQMVKTGRLTAEEAERMQMAGEAHFDDVVRDVRVRHAAASLDTAVEEGRMTRQEADELLQRLKNGEHPRGVRAHLHRRRPAEPSRSNPLDLARSDIDTGENVDPSA